MSNTPLNKDQDPEDHESLLKLEKAILDNDPHFQEEIQDLTSIANENLNLELLDIDKVLEDENSNTLKAKLHRFSNLINSGFTRLVLFFIWFFEFLVKELIPNFISILIGQSKKLVAAVSSFLLFTSRLSAKKKSILVLLILGSVGSVYYFFKVFKDGILSHEQRPFIYSIEELAENKYIIDQDLFEDFYSSPRFNQNIISLRRIVVNLKKSKNSSSNPMVAIELFLQGNSSEVLIEVRDRESEILDLFQGEIRAFNYDDLDTVSGKNKLTEKLKFQIDQILVKGKINKIFYKTFVIKR
ncbi:MAG: flagellar basal body-associated FliL family protein [Deltaproteobacteria bacterium]|jgi:flagellar basal body-associated protein FliL|nr:flagellar basal body-associated FliL family protein [Deltaproteobacteria bacterium]